MENLDFFSKKRIFKSISVLILSPIGWFINWIMEKLADQTTTKIVETPLDGIMDIVSIIAPYIFMFGVVFLLCLWLYWKLQDISRAINYFDIHLKYLKLHSNTVNEILKDKIAEDELDDFFSKEELEVLGFYERDIRRMKSDTTRKIIKKIRIK